MRYRFLLAPLIATTLGLLTAAVAHASEAPADAAAETAPLESSARSAVGPDTVRYRVCKDLSICFLDFASPVLGIASPVLPPGAAPVSLTPVERFALSPQIAVGTPWMMIGFPILAYAFIDRGNAQIPGGGGGGGGGTPPGTIETPPSENPPGTDPPGNTTPGTNPPGTDPPLTNVAPEPVSMVLLATGLAGLALLRRRKRAAPDA